MERYYISPQDYQRSLVAATRIQKRFRGWRTRQQFIYNLRWMYQDIVTRIESISDSNRAFHLYHGPPDRLEWKSPMYPCRPSFVPCHNSSLNTGQIQDINNDPRVPILDLRQPLEEDIEEDISDHEDRPWAPLDTIDAPTIDTTEDVDTNEREDGTGEWDHLTDAQLEAELRFLENALKERLEFLERDKSSLIQTEL